jgi:hypothetical protein
MLSILAPFFAPPDKQAGLPAAEGTYSHIPVVIEFLSAARAKFVEMVMGYFIEFVQTFIGLNTFFRRIAF